jgi:hypothetical protein
MRTVVAGASAGLVVLLAAACYADRARPDPSEPTVSASLTAQILEPRHGAAVLGNRPLTVRVQGRDLSGTNLTGVGFVARRAGTGSNATLDSAAHRPGPGSVLEHSFEFPVPDLPTNSQVDVFAISYGPGTQARLSVPSSLIVIRCQPGIPGC